MPRPRGVRKHRAPKGALRPIEDDGLNANAVVTVRKHRAPKGALRLIRSVLADDARPRQKAPSAKRCIKTMDDDGYALTATLVRKHRAPKGALRHDSRYHRGPAGKESQKAPSAKRCIKTASPPGGWFGFRWSESTERQKVH